MLNNPNQSYTLFVPTNDAFAKLATNLGISEDDLYKEPQLAAILLYHIVPGQQLAVSALGSLPPVIETPPPRNI